MRYILILSLGLGLLACGEENEEETQAPGGEKMAGADAGAMGSDPSAEYDNYGAGGAGGSSATAREGGEAEAGERGVLEDLPLPERQENDFIESAEDALSTFSIDVDTASYTQMRGSIKAGRLPDPQGVRVEEYLNFFRYKAEAPDPDTEIPFNIRIEAAPSPFGEGLQLLRVGIKGSEIPEEMRAPANLVFLIDVSGSMNASNKLGYVKRTLDILLAHLRDDDTIGIVTYAGRDTVALRPTPVAQQAEIRAAIETLEAGGSTNGASGIRSAYELAETHFRPEGINRVILCTDGDFNVGVTGEALVREVESWQSRGIDLSVLGYGYNLNDRFIEELSNRGEGNYFFIDSPNEALRVVGEGITGMLQVIARDVKIQVEMHPERVRRYRLIGYETRDIADDDFRNDSVDAGEVGSGHFVNALFELELKPEGSGERLVTLRLRYKDPEDRDGDAHELEHPFQLEDLKVDLQEASPDLRFTAAVAEFAEILRRSMHSEEAHFSEVVTLLESLELNAERQELLSLVRQAATLWP